MNTLNRNDEYKSLLDELDDTPAALEYTVTRANARTKKAKKIRRSFAVPIGSAAALFVSFTILVNVSMPFAMAAGRIPILRELAAAVAFSPSLSAAVANEYVQLIETEQSENGITMRVEYIIVDQKQLNIFYTLNSQIYSNMDTTSSIRGIDGNQLDGYSIITLGSADNGQLREITIDFLDNDVPDGLLLTCKAHDNVTPDMSEPPQQVSDDMLFQIPEYTEPDYIAAFEFTLNFDPYFTNQGETITLGKSFILDGQRLTISTVEIYPTHARVNIEDDPSNTAWLTSLDFYFENDKGVRFEAINNGITATGSPDSPMMRSHRLESSFFAGSKRLTLYITRAVWLDKDMGRVKVDLANTEAEALPEGVVFEHAEQKYGGWELIFSGMEYEQHRTYQLFGWEYYDEYGSGYIYNSVSSGMISPYIEREGVFFIQFALQDYPYDTVYLSPSFSRITSLDQPIVIGLK